MGFFDHVMLASWLPDLSAFRLDVLGLDLGLGPESPIPLK